MATHKQIALVFKKKKNQPPKLVETLSDFKNML